MHYMSQLVGSSTQHTQWSAETAFMRIVILSSRIFLQFASYEWINVAAAHGTRVQDGLQEVCTTISWLVLVMNSLELVLQAVVVSTTGSLHR